MCVILIGLIFKKETIKESWPYADIWLMLMLRPKVIKEILYRAADRESGGSLLVANQRLSIPASPYLAQYLQVSCRF